MSNSFVIRSRLLEKEFYFVGAGRYVFVYAGKAKEPMLICVGGGFVGAAVMHDGESKEDLERVCRNWYRAHIRDYKKFLPFLG